MSNYAIRWKLNPPSYFKTMTKIGPAFGSTIQETPKFPSRIDAGRVQNGFPIVPMIGSEIVELCSFCDLRLVTTDLTTAGLASREGAELCCDGCCVL